MCMTNKSGEPVNAGCVVTNYANGENLRAKSL